LTSRASTWPAWLTTSEAGKVHSMLSAAKLELAGAPIRPRADVRVTDFAIPTPNSTK
jgi:hypothetical protein